MLQEEKKWKQSIEAWNFFLHLFIMTWKKKPNINLTFQNQHEFTKYVNQTTKRSTHHSNAHEISKVSSNKAWEILYCEDITDYSDSEGTTSHETLQFGDQEIASETN